MLLKLINNIKNLFKKQHHLTPEICPVTTHNINAQMISKNALLVVTKLQAKGFSAYIVGGSIRDAILDIPPKDYDIVTNASPEQIKKLFHNCLLIGKRFRLAHIRFRNEIIEVATFRAAHKRKILQNDIGMIVRDNAYGSIEDDVIRRDFTINALFYNPKTQEILDYVSGVADIHNKTIRLIGDPTQRYAEDPVRMLRAIRFAVKLNFQLEANTAAAIRQNYHLLAYISPSRLFEEYFKLFMYGHAYKTYQALQEFHLLEQLFPCVTFISNDIYQKLLAESLTNTDQRLQEGKTLSPAFLLAIFLWPALQHLIQQLIEDGLPKGAAPNHAYSKVFHVKYIRMSIPKKIQLTIMEIWKLQQRFERNRVGVRIINLLDNTRFRAGYDFLLLRAAAGDLDAAALATWWTTYLAANTEDRQQMSDSIKKLTSKQKRQRNNKKKAKVAKLQPVTTDDQKDAETVQAVGE